MDAPPLRPTEDYAYSDWEVRMAERHPLALSEMRWPSHPRGAWGARAVARWGIECWQGWRPIMERLLDRLEAAIGSQPMDRRDRYRIVQIKEKLGVLTVYLASEGTAEMKAAINAAADESVRTCELCGEPGVLAERRAWWAVRCSAHEDWNPWSTSH
jgi:hypothetical protein